MIREDQGLEELSALGGDCRRFREELVAVSLGEEPELPAEELRRHLEGCAGCRRAAKAVAGLDELLKSVQPPPAPAGLRRLRVAVAALESNGAELRSPPASRGGWLVAAAVSAAAAAAIVVAFVNSWPAGKSEADRLQAVAVMVGRENASGLAAADGGWAPGQRLVAGAMFKVPAGERVRLAFDRGAQVEVTGTGIADVALQKHVPPPAGAEGSGTGFVEVAAADRVRITDCKLLAAVEKGRAPFCVETRHARVVTLGTRFTVETGEGGTHVTVLDGRVRFERAGRPESFVEVAAGQTSSISICVDGDVAAPSAPAATAPENLAWLLAPPRPQLELRLAAARPEIRAGERLVARLELVNRSSAAVRIDGCGRAAPAYFVRVTDPAGRQYYLCPAVLGSLLDGEPSGAAVVELKPGSGYALELDVGSLSGPPGEYRLAGIYFGALRSENAGWSGTLESGPATVNRRK